MIMVKYCYITMFCSLDFPIAVHVASREVQLTYWAATIVLGQLLSAVRVWTQLALIYSII